MRQPPLSANPFSKPLKMAGITQAKSRFAKSTALTTPRGRGGGWLLPLNQERKFSPKRKFGPDIPAHIRPKTSVRPSKSWKNKHFRTDIPRGRPGKNFGLRNFGLIFRSLLKALYTSGRLAPLHEQQGAGKAGIIHLDRSPMGLAVQGVVDTWAEWLLIATADAVVLVARHSAMRDSISCDAPLLSGPK